MRVLAGLIFGQLQLLSSGLSAHLPVPVPAPLAAQQMADPVGITQWTPVVPKDGPTSVITDVDPQGFRGTLQDKQVVVDQDLWPIGIPSVGVASLKWNRGQGFTAGVPGRLHRVDVLMCLEDYGPSGANLELAIIDMETGATIATDSVIMKKTGNPYSKCPESSQTVPFYNLNAPNITQYKHYGLNLRWDHMKAVDGCTAPADKIYDDCLYANDTLPCYETSEVAKTRCVLRPKMFWVTRDPQIKYSGGGSIGCPPDKIPSGGVKMPKWPCITPESDEKPFGVSIFKTYIMFDLDRYTDDANGIPRPAPPVYDHDGQSPCEKKEITNAEHSGKKPWELQAEFDAAQLKKANASAGVEP